MSETIVRNVNLQPETYDLVQAESLRRRNGGKGFSLTLNQIVLEWLDAFNAGIMPLDAEKIRRFQEMPAVKSVNTSEPHILPEVNA
jgi:hypothetical protein